MNLTPLLAAPSGTHPTLPGDATWVGIVLIAIAALFLAALVIGLLVRLNAPDLPVPTHSPAEPPLTRH